MTFQSPNLLKIKKLKNKKLVFLIGLKKIHVLLVNYDTNHYDTKNSISMYRQEYMVVQSNRSYSFYFYLFISFLWDVNRLTLRRFPQITVDGNKT